MIQGQLNEEAEKGEARMRKEVDRQLREESFSEKTGQEEWMKIGGHTGKDLTRRITEIEGGGDHASTNTVRATPEVKPKREELRDREWERGMEADLRKYKQEL